MAASIYFAPGCPARLQKNFNFLAIHALLTITQDARRTRSEEPNPLCGDRCNAPVIRRVSSALLKSSL
jgi:hypothetical protein